MNKYTTFFEDLLKILAAFSIMLILVGYVDLKTYYRYFGINIAGYISTSEIILASLDSLSLLLFSLLLQLGIWLSFFSFLFEWTEKDLEKYWEGKARPNLFSSDLTMERFINSKSTRILALSLFIPAVIFGILKFNFPQSGTLFWLYLFFGLNMFLFMCIYMGGLVITRFLFKKVEKQSNYNPKLVVAFLIFLPTLLFTVYIKNQMFIGNKIRKYGNSDKIRITLQNDSTITPNDSIRYIGRTENYFFFWNKNKWNSIIVPSGEVKEIATIRH